MELIRLEIHNYKSLRSIELSPERVNGFVGPNGAGKTNLVDCLDFLSECYRLGVELAVARKGGYESIAHRKMRRTKAGISFQVGAYFEPAEVRIMNQPKLSTPLYMGHYFELRARGGTIRSEYDILNESFFIATLTLDLQLHRIATIDRQKDQIKLTKDDESLFRTVGLRDIDYFTQDKRRLFNSSESFMVAFSRLVPLFSVFNRALGAIRAYNISPRHARDVGIPIANAELERSGGNLPAVVDFLKRGHPKSWNAVMESMRSIMPNLTSINVDYTVGQTLGLFFEETGIGRPWSVNQVSDGTMQALALLTAIHNPRSSIIAIEEIENSLHPWIVRDLIRAAKRVNTKKQLFLTTHSPMVMNELGADSISVVWRESGETRIEALGKLDHNIVEAWKRGEIETFDAIATGAIGQAIPPSE
jgi:predicted ATPase